MAGKSLAQFFSIFFLAPLGEGGAILELVMNLGQGRKAKGTRKHGQMLHFVRGRVYMYRASVVTILCDGTFVE